LHRISTHIATTLTTNFLIATNKPGFSLFPIITFYNIIKLSLYCFRSLSEAEPLKESNNNTYCYKVNL